MCYYRRVQTDNPDEPEKKEGEPENRGNEKRPPVEAVLINQLGALRFVHPEPPRNKPANGGLFNKMKHYTL